MSTAVLVVEDDEQISEVLTYRLELDDYEVVVIEDGEDCWEYLESTDELPDAMLLDIMLPGIDGFGLLRRFETDERYDDLPIILITGRGLEDDVVEGFTLGADDYVVKPFSPSEVAVRLDRLLQ
ncbi:response regulator receiver protein [Halovivax asiaticus JCM 14624]|uniref:Response regulator receiver protein n=1 Tax=Halovivax asiaticus JCM 14624 TaxID=1227490 RepID=M0BCX0_9EURY|nr:response regulator [Halovivax asiaticus]ELZ08322.1 response regulator receiver protein [Halovivax asiaticus JCM 14624]